MFAWACDGSVWTRDCVVSDNSKSRNWIHGFHGLTALMGRLDHVLQALDAVPRSARKLLLSLGRDGARLPDGIV
jgi:hypothetical protein